MKTIRHITLVALLFSGMIFGQVVVAGQTSTIAGQTATFSIKAKKAPKLTLQPATCACVAPNCSIDPVDGSYVIVPGQSVTCTVTAVLTPAGPIASTSSVSLSSADSTQITVPAAVNFAACALTPCSVSFPMSATP